MEDKSSGCLAWVLLLVGFIPGMFIASKLPLGHDVGMLVFGGVAVFALIMAAIYKKPDIFDETFGHAMKRIMWFIVCGVSAGVAIAFAFAGNGKKDDGASKVEQVQQVEESSVENLN